MENKIKCPHCAHWFDAEEALHGKLVVYFKAENEKKTGSPQKNSKDEVQCPKCGYWIDLKGIGFSKPEARFKAEYENKRIEEAENLN